MVSKRLAAWTKKDSADMSESDIQAEIVQYLRAHGAYVYVTHDAYHRPTQDGVPDILACYQGQFIAIECKKGKAKPTKEQEEDLDWIDKAGGIALVGRSVEDAKEAIR